MTDADGVKPWNVVACMMTTAAIDFFRAPPGNPSISRTRKRKRIEQTLAADIQNGIVQGHVFLHEGNRTTLLGAAKQSRFIAAGPSPSLFEKLLEARARREG